MKGGRRSAKASAATGDGADPRFIPLLDAGDDGQRKIVRHVVPRSLHPEAHRRAGGGARRRRRRQAVQPRARARDEGVARGDGPGRGLGGVGEGGVEGGGGEVVGRTAV